jgi:hypothetical protein
MSALGVSLSMRCRRGGQLAAVAEPPSGFGRILIIAAASSSPGAGAAIVTIPVGRSPSPPSPTAKAPRWAACRTPSRHQAGASLGTALVGAVLIASLTTGLVNGVQDSSAILANVTTHATTQLEAGVPVHLRQRPEGQLQKANVRPTRPDAIVKPTATSACRAAHLAVGGCAHRRRRPVLHRTYPHRAGWASQAQLATADPA